MKPNHAPAVIALIVFNRPDHTRRVLDALAKNALAAQSPLYIFSDAARGPVDVEAVEKVRSVIKSVKGFKQVSLIERETNYGCSRNVLSAIQEVLDKHDRCIVVEDDILTYPLFLTYMNAALDLYQDDSTVFSVGAYSHAFPIPNTYKEETFLLYRSCSWGWGTWKTAWEKINLDQRLLDEGMANPMVRKGFDASGEDLIRTYKASPEIWDLRICFQQWSLGLKTLFPVQPLVMNIGRDGSGTHYNEGALTSEDNYNAPQRIPVLHPLTEVDENVRKAYNKVTHKPVWRILLANLAKRTGIYQTLLRWVNSR